MQNTRKIVIRHNDGYVVIRVPEGDFDFWCYNASGELISEGWIPNPKDKFELDANENIWKE
ncbi:hypothetical protein [Bacillus sp. ISL-55]|uniref:hypothetical protein n=1 Tax=Bacillus sp. ISL-55 TaxID=2819134 RepID=UPI001BEA664B|nr:hypothetical protein [Bacillus sp. ISL-55]MBT2695431.1 hypothetical protein [Bacillus sp. ISL-55]